MTDFHPGTPPRRAFVGDVHGCFDELLALFAALGFSPRKPAAADRIDEVWFVGDLVNGGPKPDQVLTLVDGLQRSGRGGFVAGNHEDHLLRAIDGDRNPSERTRASLARIDASPVIDRMAAQRLLRAAPLTRQFADAGILLVHAAPFDPDSDPATQRQTALYGPLAGGSDNRGRPLRVNWARDYAGDDLVLFGHSPHREPARFSRAICLDTGCVYGGTLTAYLPHEDAFVSVPARKAYASGYVRDSKSMGSYL
jgi:protein phosphatase